MNTTEMNQLLADSLAAVDTIRRALVALADQVAAPPAQPTTPSPALVETMRLALTNTGVLNEVIRTELDATDFHQAIGEVLEDFDLAPQVDRALASHDFSETIEIAVEKQLDDDVLGEKIAEAVSTWMETHSLDSDIGEAVDAERRDIQGDAGSPPAER